MTKLLLVFAIIIFSALTINFSQVKANKLVFWYTPKGETLSLKEAVIYLKDYDVIMFGEYHDQYSIHQEQELFLQEFYKETSDIALSLEMIEKDNDDMLQKYLHSEISEEAFLSNTRPWPRYKKDYAPMVNFCKANKLDVIASNIPRYLASQYAKEGTLANIPEDKKMYLPKIHLADKDRYFEEFAKVMSGDAMNIPEERLWNFYRAQCIKDDMMAQSIFEYIEKNPNTKVIHMQGGFHGRYHLGVADKLQRLAPNLKIAVISPIFITDDNKEKLAINSKEDGDLLLLTHQVNADKKD